jgi:class 3 adenylate cyclase
VLSQEGPVVRVGFALEDDDETNAVAAMETLEAMRAAIDRLVEPRLQLRAGLSFESLPVDLLAQAGGIPVISDVAAHLSDLAPPGELRLSSSAAAALGRRKPRPVGQVVARAGGGLEAVYALPIAA